MNNLIVFISKYGSAERCAKLLADELQGDTIIVNLKKEQVSDLNIFEKVILGGSVYMGKTLPEITRFAKDNLLFLQTKKIGIFVTCKETSEKKHDQIKISFPTEIIEMTSGFGFFGDEVTYDKCSFIDKTMIRMISGKKNSYSNIDRNEISRFAKMMNEL